MAHGGDTGFPVALAPSSNPGTAAAEFAAIVTRLHEVVPGHPVPDVDMSGCTARMLAAATAALDAT